MRAPRATGWPRPRWASFRRFLELTRDGERPSFQIADDLRVRLTLAARSRRRVARMRAGSGELRMRVAPRVRAAGASVRGTIEERRRARRIR